jgi:hypothetical protein
MLEIVRDIESLVELAIVLPAAVAVGAMLFIEWRFNRGKTAPSRSRNAEPTPTHTANRKAAKANRPSREEGRRVVVDLGTRNIT